MEYKEGRLGYNRKNDRYGLLVTDLWEIDGFSCGNRLQVKEFGILQEQILKALHWKIREFEC